MGVPSYSVVCHELHAARQHLYDMVRELSQDELLWLPPRPDGICISYHFGHIALVEDTQVAERTDGRLIAASEFREAFGAHNADRREAHFPAASSILDYMQRVRTRTLEAVALSFRKTPNENAVIAAAEPFRRIINHEYSHTKYIRRICGEMGKPPVAPPASELVCADDNAIAPPQYGIPRW
jgi:hypothetical protein